MTKYFLMLSVSLFTMVASANLYNCTAIKSNLKPEDTIMNIRVLVTNSKVEVFYMKGAESFGKFGVIDTNYVLQPNETNYVKYQLRNSELLLVNKDFISGTWYGQVIWYDSSNRTASVTYACEINE